MLVFIEHGTRRMHLGGRHREPHRRVDSSAGRNFGLTLGERFEHFQFLIRDRGSNFTQSFNAVFQAAGTRILRTAVQAPRMNSYAERFVGALRRECLDHVLILGEWHLRDVLAEYVRHYNGHRPQQALRQKPPLRELGHAVDITARIERRRVLGGLTGTYTRVLAQHTVLGGLINEYERAA